MHSVSFSNERSSSYHGALHLAPQRSRQPELAKQNYFTGKEVVLKIDMPGTQQGVDLRFSKDNPMNWKEYSGPAQEYRRGDP